MEVEPFNITDDAVAQVTASFRQTVRELCIVIEDYKRSNKDMPIVSAEELAWALDTHVDYAQAVLDRIRAFQRREPYIPSLPVEELAKRANRAVNIFDIKKATS